MKSEVGRWVLGLTYILAVAPIWIAASFVVQSVVDEGVSPFLITYICNSLFVVYIPIVEIRQYLEDNGRSLLFWKSKKKAALQELEDSEESFLLGQGGLGVTSDGLGSSMIVEEGDGNSEQENGIVSVLGNVLPILGSNSPDRDEVYGDSNKGLDVKGRWTRTRVAKVSLIICPFWFFAQLTFNLSLKYTTVTSNTILCSASSLFTFLVSLAFLGEKFTWLKLVSVLLCMAGTIIVSLGDSTSMLNAVATNPLLGDILALVSAGLYAVYITLIRKMLPDDDGKSGCASMAQFLGYLGLFNLLIFLPVALILNFTKLEPFDMLTSEQFGLVVGKGLLDNVLSDYLWAKAVLLTTTTVATAGLTIQIPLAAIVDVILGNAPRLMDYTGALVVIIGFLGINVPTNTLDGEAVLDLENENATPAADQSHPSLEHRANVS